MGNRSEIVARRPAEEKQLIRALQTAANKMPSAPESPFSFHNVTDQEREGGVGFACDQNFNTCYFVPCGKHTSACISKVVMAA
jgi:hypothetical protein